MHTLTDEQRHERFEALMARRQMKRIKIVTTSHKSKHYMDYELTGDL